ncbi:MAG: acetolactate synthase [Paracoccaceae bacterium]|nr:MAG: acetolactate synthase [Paracoccaceae bacterium]
MRQGSAVAADDTPIPVPSGQSVTLIEVIWAEPGPEGLTFRFRFLAPQIAPGGGITFDAAVEDMAFLCQDYALPRLSDIGPVPAQVIVSLSDRPVVFGEADPEATQFFEAYRVEDGICIWEAF